MTASLRSRVRSRRPGAQMAMKSSGAFIACPRSQNPPSARSLPQAAWELQRPGKHHIMPGFASPCPAAPSPRFGRIPGEGETMVDSRAREAVGVFHDENSLRAAVDELWLKGFDRSSISLMAGHRTIEQRLGHLYRRVTEVEQEPTLPRQAYAAGDSRTEAKGVVAGGLAYVGATAAAGAVVMSGGTLAIAIAAAALALGAGGLIGAVLGKLIDRRHA